LWKIKRPILPNNISLLHDKHVIYAYLNKADVVFYLPTIIGIEIKLIVERQVRLEVIIRMIKAMCHLFKQENVNTNTKLPPINSLMSSIVSIQKVRFLGVYAA